MGKEETLRKAKQAMRLVGTQGSVRTGLGNDIRRKDITKKYPKLDEERRKREKAARKKKLISEYKESKKNIVHKLGDKLRQHKILPDEMEALFKRDKMLEHGYMERERDRNRTRKVEAIAPTKRHEGKSLEERLRKLEKGSIGLGGLGGSPVDAPVARSYNAPRTGFKIGHNANGPGGADSIHLHGTDYLTTLVGTKLDDVVGTTIYSVVINPRTLGVNRLLNFSRLFEKYYMKLKIKYNQATTTEKTGSGIGFFEMDVDDEAPPATQDGVTEAFGHVGNKSTSWWRNCEWTMPHATSEEFWIDEGEEERLVNQAIFYLLVEVPAGESSTPGTLSVEWECRFWQSKTDVVDFEASNFWALSSGSESATDPFESGTVLPGSKDFGIVESTDGKDSIFTLPVSDYAYWIVTFSLTDSVATGAITASQTNFSVNQNFVLNSETKSYTRQVLYSVPNNELVSTFIVHKATVGTVSANQITFVPVKYSSSMAAERLSRTIRKGEELGIQLARMLELIEKDKIELQRMSKAEEQKLDVERKHSEKHRKIDEEKDKEHERRKKALEEFEAGLSRMRNVPQVDTDVELVEYRPTPKAVVRSKK